MAKEDFRREKELAEARKAGTIPAERDEEGNEINPHIPQYIVKAPWYVDTGAPSLKHQRVQAEEESNLLDDEDEAGSEVTAAMPVKGGCENCGSVGHRAKDCLERPRKMGSRHRSRGTSFSSQNKKKDKSFDAKRDRWAGYDAGEYIQVIESFENVEAERRRLKEAEMEAALLATDKDTLDSSSSDSGDSDDEEKYAEAADMPGQKVDSKARMTVRNLRLREDTAKYLRNLDPESAYYDPKTRSMRENPHPEAADPSLLPFAGDNFVRQSGDAVKMAELQVFAWQAAEKGIEINLQANPSEVERLHKEHVAQQSEEAKRREQVLADAYGSPTNGRGANESSESEIDPLIDTI